MPIPVINWRTEVDGIVLYHDRDNPNLLHYSPSRRWTELKVRSPGTKLTMLDGHIEFELTRSQWNTLSQRLPGMQIAPLVAVSVAETLSSAIEVSEPHAITVRVLQSIPFPTVIVSATLRQNAPDYQQTLDQIREAWRSETALSGKLVSTYTMREVKLAAVVTLDRQKIDTEVRKYLTGNRWPQKTVMAAIRAAVKAQLDNWAKAVGPVSSGLSEEVRWFLEQEITHRHAIQQGSLVTFDNGQQVEAWAIRDPRELEPVTLVRLDRSVEESLDLDLLV